MHSGTLTKDIKQWFKRFVKIKPPLEETTPERLCLTFNPHALSIARVTLAPNKIPQLRLAESIVFEDNQSITTQLASVVRKYQLDTYPANWLLDPADYDIFLIEPLPVPAEEFNDALKWRIKTLLSYPVEDAVIDYFKIPAKKAGSDAELIAAVTCRRETLQPRIEILKNNGLLLNRISIPELALKNLSVLRQHNKEQSYAFLYFYEQVALLTITRNQQLYFTRRINLPTQNSFALRDYEKICLEVLRYFDYFQSQWRSPAPNHIFIASNQRNTQELCDNVRQFLQVDVESYTFQSLLQADSNALQIEKCLLPIGALLGEEMIHAASRD